MKRERIVEVLRQAPAPLTYAALHQSTGIAPSALMSACASLERQGRVVREWWWYRSRAHPTVVRLSWDEENGTSVPEPRLIGPWASPWSTLDTISGILRGSRRTNA
jgi:hypothetical protein